MRSGTAAIVGRWSRRPPLLLGIVVALACVAAETFLARLLSQITPARSLEVVYLLGIVAVAAIWGLWLGLVTAAISTLALDYFLTPPLGSLTLNKAEDWTVLAIFFAVTVLAGSISRLARSLALEIDARGEADLAAELARVLLQTPDLKTAEPAAARLLSDALGLPYAAIERGAVSGDGRRVAFPLHDRGVPAASLIVPAGLPRSTLRRLRERVVPSLEITLRAARERERAANQQVALRRLATLVAQEAPPEQVFGAVAREVGRLLEAPHAAVIRYEPDGTAASNVGIWDRSAPIATPPKGRWPLEPDSAAELVARTGETGRVEPVRVPALAGEFRASLRTQTASAVGCPVTVGGRLWGAVIVVSPSEPLPDDIEKRLGDFIDLLVTAIMNAESRAELEASRARVIAAADATRRLIERDLHEGVQQHLVALLLELRAATATPPDRPGDVRRMLRHTARALDEVLEDLRGLARGLHPALLSRQGLEPAIRALARCSPVPVELNIHAGRVAERSEVTAYHVVSEALTNVAKHADASVAHVELTVRDGAIRLSIRDDGTGGADTARGSGLLSIRDRVEAIGGRFEISSPADGGTALFAEIPITGD
jgi:signal transduction histidine kinase